MLNRTSADLANATVRTRYFQGRSADEIAEDMPLLPVDAPGLPQPGPSFVRTARLLGDPQPKQEFTKMGKPKKVTGYRPTGPYLTALVRSCLYQTGTVIPVGPDDAHSESFTFLPGLMMGGAKNGTDLYGPGQCRLMVVGKCLGKAEVEQGRTFVGKGSEHLWNAWRDASLPKPSKDFPVFFTNLARFLPPLSMKDRFPKEVVQDGTHLLYQEIAACRPELILILGADALKALFGSKAKVADYTGRTALLEVDCRPTPDTPPDVHAATVIVADHPAKVYRDPEIYPQFLSSIRRASQALGFVDKAEEVKKDYQKVLTLAELKAAVLESEKESALGGAISFDCEWEGKHPSEEGSYLYTVQWSHAPGHARTVFLRHCGGALNASLPLDQARPWLKRLFEKAPERGARLVAHFGKADLPWLYSIGVNLYESFVGPDHDDKSSNDALEAGDKTYFEGGFDTYVAAHACDENSALKLELLVANRLGVDRYDTDIIAWRDTFCKQQKIKKSQLKGYGRVPENTLFPYACLHRDSLVQLGDGSWRRICDLVSEKYDGTVRAFKDGQVISAQVTGWHRHEAGQKVWYQLRTRTTTEGRWGLIGPVFTPDHEIVTRRGKVRVDCLRCGEDQILTDDRELSADQLSVALGCLLGDGGFREKNGKGIGFRFSQREAAAEYASWKASIFANYSPTCATTDKGYRCYTIAFNRCFADLAYRFPRKSRSEHGTRKLVITPTVLSNLGDLGLAVWYQDDGSFVKGATDVRGSSRLYCVIDETEQALVVKWLSDKFGDGIRYNKNNQYIQIGGEAFERFHTAVLPYIHPVMAYKTPYALPDDSPALSLVGAPLYETITRVTPWSPSRGRRGYGVRYCLSVASTGNFLTQVGFVSNCSDVDMTMRLYLHFNGDPRTGTRGVLDCDKFGNSSRKIFGLRMRAWGAWAEMERYGLEVDRYQHRALREQIVTRRDELLAEFREKAQWKDGPNGQEGFAPTKTRHKVEFLFGEQYSKDQKAIRPPGALSLYLKPYKSTKASGGRLWDEALWRAKKDGLPDPVPAADKETTVILSRQHKLVALLKDIDLLTTAMKIMFRLPVEPDDEDEEGFDDEIVEYTIDPEDEIHDRGFLSLIDADGRIRSVFGIVETGRASSSRPNLQNQSESTDEQYDRILRQGASAPDDAPEEVKQRYFRTKSVMRARAGWFLVAADLKGAEIAAAGWTSGDPLLIEHARRATLDADDPDVLDLHSDLAKSAFKLECTLKEVKKLHKSKRTGAKRARFGHYYGASPDSIFRKALEDDPNVTLEDIVALVKNHDQIYPVLANHFAMTRKRVTTHGWFKNGYGGNRRFHPATDRERVAGQEREAQNWLCQGKVADNITSALGNTWFEIRKRKLQSRIVLSIHDSIMCEVPAHEVIEIVDDLLPLCMSHGNPVPITDLDGNPVGRGPYYFGIDTTVYRSWGVEVEENDWRAACEQAKAQIRNGA